MSDRLNDKTITAEERICDDYVSRVRAGNAPPRSYLVGANTLDAITDRTLARIKFGPRGRDGKRPESILLHTSHGIANVCLDESCHGDEIVVGEYTP